MAIYSLYRRFFLIGFAIATVVSFFFGYVAGLAAPFIALAVKQHSDRPTEAEERKTERVGEYIATGCGAIAAIFASIAVSFLWLLLEG